MFFFMIIKLGHIYLIAKSFKLNELDGVYIIIFFVFYCEFYVHNVSRKTTNRVPTIPTIILNR